MNPLNKPALFLSLLLFIPKVFCFQSDSSFVKYYRDGVSALADLDTTKAELYFRKSIDEDKNAPALFELAKILISKKTIRDRDKARKFLQTAIFKEPKNIEYRLLMAALMEYFSSGLAFKEYEKIIEIDSTNTTSLFQMGRIDEENFDDYYHSVTQDDPDSPMLSLDDYAMEDFRESENYFKKVLSIDSANSQAILHLSSLYESAGKPEKAVPLLEKLTRLNPDNKNAYLYLGLMYYKTSDFEGAYEAYKNALILMDEKERRDFTFNSVKELIKPLFSNEFKNLTDPELEAIINLYWKVKDPLYLNKYNERLLEHYSRVAYSNLRFTVKKQKEPGWKSDRGEVVLRYGEPLERIRFRPQISVGDKIQIKAKTDVWYYTDMVFGFEDPFFNGQFSFCQPVSESRIIPQFAGDSYSFFKYVKRIRNETYDPKFEGPKFSVPYEIVQFKNLDENKTGYTDVYVNYGLKSADSLYSGNKFIYNHSTGLFFFDQYFETIAEKRDSIPLLSAANKIEVSDTSSFVVNSLAMSVKPDSGNFAFEIKRNSDKGVSSNHIPLSVKHFSSSTIDMSDVLLANGINEGSSVRYALLRKKINILPNPLSTFSEKNKVFIYYEIYNLTPDTNGISNVEQKLTIRKIDNSPAISKAFNSVLNIFGAGKKEQEITLTTRYQFSDRNPQVYFQLDMSKYEPGSYILTISIKDNITGREKEQRVDLIWK